MEFYKIMYFIIIMNCDWFLDKKKNYNICKTAPAARLYNTDEKCESWIITVLGFVWGFLVFVLFFF